MKITRAHTWPRPPLLQVGVRVHRELSCFRGDELMKVEKCLILKDRWSVTFYPHSQTSSLIEENTRVK